ncbi:glycoside hydrolase family 30 protein [Stipitochalara longipes BDJ]|nr:glycoside hydrolase family 30 protein [Stipitochalara longipes BDJ]
MFSSILLVTIVLQAFSIFPHAYAQLRITVDASLQYQHVDGFGISASFQRAQQIYGKYGLSPTNRTKVLDLLFSNTTGASLTILRNGIGSANSSSLDYMNSIQPLSPGSPAAAPFYNWDGNDSGQVWLSQVAAGYGVKTFAADAWSAPGYMKSNNDDTHGGSLCGVTNTSCATGDWRQAYADYIVQYLSYYAAAGIKVTHVGFVNEPELYERYASMISNGTQSADFLRVLAPTLKAAGLDTKITCCDAAGWKSQARMLAGIQAAGAESLVGVVTSHGYSSPLNGTLNTTLPVWQTEWSDLRGNWTNDWYFNHTAGEGLTWAVNIQKAFTESNVSAFIYWQGAEMTGRNTALIRLAGDSYQVSKRLWAMAQFSRFVRPDAMRIDADGGNEQVHVSAFKNFDGVVAVQVINNSTNATDIELALGGGKAPTSLQAFLTDNENDLTDLGQVTAGKNGTWESTLPARSMVSFVGVYM